MNIKKLKYTWWLLLLIGKAYASKEVGTPSLLEKEGNNYIKIKLFFKCSQKKRIDFFCVIFHKATPIKKHVVALQKKLLKNDNESFKSIGFECDTPRDSKGELIPYGLSEIAEKETLLSLAQKENLNLSKCFVYTDKELFKDEDEVTVITPQKVMTVGEFIKEETDKTIKQAVDEAVKGNLGIYWVFLIIGIALCTGALIESEIQLLQDQGAFKYNPYYNLLDIIDEEDY